MDTFHIKLDLDKSRPIINEPIGIRQNDGSVTTIVAEIFDHGQPATDLGTEISFRCIRPNFTKYIDTKNIEVSGNTITFKTSTKLSKEPGLIKIAHFLIGGDSTQDFLIDVKRGVFFTDDDYIKIIGNFKGRKRLDRNSNPNEIWMANMVSSDNNTLTLNKDPAVSEAPESIYKFFNNPIYSFIFARGQENDDQSTVWYNHLAYIPENTSNIFYLFKIDPRTVKIRINNLYNGDLTNNEIGFGGVFGKCTQIFVANRSLGITDNVGDLPGSKKGFQKSLCKNLTPNLNLSGYTPLQNEAFSNDTSINDTRTYTSSFELDLTKNNFLTSDNYLMLYTQAVYLGGTPTCLACIAPQIECIQYYLPE